MAHTFTYLTYHFVFSTKGRIACISPEHHHKKISFQEEFLSFLKHHGISYEERYIWE